jgi:hypothetical protein
MQTGDTQARPNWRAILIFYVLALLVFLAVFSGGAMSTQPVGRPFPFGEKTRSA